MTASVSFPVFGSTAVVMVTDGGQLDPAVEAVQRVVDEFDRACSRFRDDSELIALHRAAGRPMRVSALLREAIRTGLRAARLTDGDVDPTLGAALIALGYDRDFELGLDGRGAGGEGDAVGAASPGLAFASVPGWRAVTVDDAAGTVTLPAGVTLDLGATAKALAADHAAAAAHQATGAGVLVNLGGDLAVAGPPPMLGAGSAPVGVASAPVGAASGTVGAASAPVGAAPRAGWPIRVTDDHRAGLDAPGQTIIVAVGGLATSSITVRRWRTAGETRHHLLDPASHRPAAGDWRTVSVAAASCLDANIAATAAIVRGERAAAWLAGAGLPSRLVSRDGRARHVAGWPEAGDDLAPEPAAAAA